MHYLLSYTRKPINNVLYDPRLAFSMHLAISSDGDNFTPLNHNSGVLFAKATENPDGSLNPKCLDKPVIFAMNGSYGVIAERTGPEGEAEETTLMHVYTTNNFVDYKLTSIFMKGSADHIQFNEKLKENKFFLTTPIKTPDIEGIICSNMIPIDDACADYLCKKLLTPVNTAIRVPGTITASSIEELQSKSQAVAEYSDGTSCSKRIDWDVSTVDFNTSGSYAIQGQVHQDHYDFPIAYDRADPCIGSWNGKYYFIATNDADQNHTLYIRESDTVPGLVDAPEHLILDSSTYPEIGNLLWAPEFHTINGKLCILHAATPDPFFSEECHIMLLKDGGNPCCKDDWEKPRRIVRADGSELCESGKVITLDMTSFEWEGDYYVIWSQRQFIPKDLGAWLYIAKLNPVEPWKLASEPLVLSKPDLGWGNNHTFVEEGPFALIRGDKLYVSFSAAAVDTSYVVGLLSIEAGKDPLVVSNWKKKGYPILTSRSVDGEYGTGHNAYVIDEYGDVWNSYHGRPGTDAPRSSGIRRVHFDIDGEPVLDLTEECDVAPMLRTVKTTVIVP